MNERIRELIESCQEEVWSTNWITGSHEFEGYELDTEKFAELLVRECAKIVTIWSNEEPCSEGYDIMPVLKMKEHFGVKE